MLTAPQQRLPQFVSEERHQTFTSENVQTFLLWTIRLETPVHVSTTRAGGINAILTSFGKITELVPLKDHHTLFLGDERNVLCWRIRLETPVLYLECTTAHSCTASASSTSCQTTRVEKTLGRSGFFVRSFQWCFAGQGPTRENLGPSGFSGRSFFFQGFFTGHEPTRRPGSGGFETSRVESGRVRSGWIESSVGIRRLGPGASGPVYSGVSKISLFWSDHSDPTPSGPRKGTRPVKKPWFSPRIGLLEAASFGASNWRHRFDGVLGRLVS